MSSLGSRKAAPLPDLRGSLVRFKLSRLRSEFQPRGRDNQHRPPVWQYQIVEHGDGTKRADITRTPCRSLRPPALRISRRESAHVRLECMRHEALGYPKARNNNFLHWTRGTRQSHPIQDTKFNIYKWHFVYYSRDRVRNKKCFW